MGKAKGRKDDEERIIVTEQIFRTKRQESKMALWVNKEITGKRILQYKQRSYKYNTDV